MTGCSGLNTDEPFFGDIACHPPAAKPATTDAISIDEKVANWVIYMGRQCERHNCPQ